MKLQYIKRIVLMVTMVVCASLSAQAQHADIARMQAEFAPVMAKSVALEVITQVYDFGQRANAVRIDLGEGQSVKSVDLAPDMFTVSAENALPDGTVHFSGERLVTAVYASADGVYGGNAAEGRYLILELSGPTGRNLDGTIDEDGAETYVEGQKLKLAYTVSCGDAHLKQTGMDNLLVDRFAAAEVTEGTNTLRYRYFDPADTYQAPETGFPLVLFLHGEDERGTDNELQLVTSKGATLWLEMGEENPCYVLAPQIEGEWGAQDIDALVMKLLDEFSASHNVDTGRVYVQGFSMGGTGTWNMALKHPERFAAALPMCGYAPAEWFDGDAQAFDAIRLMPIWAFVTANDDRQLVDGTQKAVETLIAKGKAADEASAVKFELWTANSSMPPHRCWENVYLIGTPYNWLMSQSRERTEDLTISANLTYTSRKLTDEITSIRDYNLDQLYVLDKGDKALIIDTAMGEGDLYEYLREHVLTNKDCELYAFITHNHGDHYKGLKWFSGIDQLKKVYVHKDESSGTLEYIPSEKVEFVKDGQKLMFGGDELYLATVSGHSVAGTVMFYQDRFFTGDAFGSGDIWLNTTLQEFLRAMKKFVPIMNRYKEEHGYKTLAMYPGHAENKGVFNDRYVYDMLACVQGALDGSLEIRPYTRRDTAFATVNRSNISYRWAFAFGASDGTINALRTAMATAEAIQGDEYTPESYMLFKGSYAKLIDDANRACLQLHIINGRRKMHPDFTGLIKEKPAQDLTAAITDSLALLVVK